MAPTKKSDVWKHFRRDTSTGKAVCLKNPNHILTLCSSTTNLWNHLKHFHDLKNSRASTASASSLNVFVKSTPRNKVSFDSQSCSERLIKFIARHYEPLNIVENQDFKDFVKELNPNFDLPSARKLKRDMEKIYDDTKQKIKEELDDSSETVCAVTTDIWTSNQAESFLSLTISTLSSSWELSSKCVEVNSCPGSHTADNISDHLSNMCREWNIHPNQVAIITDSAANMRKATGFMNFRIVINCFAHILQCALVHALKQEEIVENLRQARKIVGHFHHSPSQTLSLVRASEKFDHIPFRKLKQEVVTRWGSTFQMLERLIAMKKPVIHVMLENKEEIPSADFWSKAEVIVSVLRPLHLISTKMSAEKSVTLSSIYPVVINLLTNTMHSKDNDEKFIIEMKKTFCEYLEKRFFEDDIRNVMEVACVLDPRFKTLPFLSETARRKAYKSVRAELDSLLEIEGNREEMAVDSSTKDSTIPSELEVLYGTFITETGNSSKQKSQSKHLLDLYLAEAEIPITEDPLSWWRVNETKHQLLAKISRFYMGIPATSASSERAFSTAGQIVTEKRNRLKPKTVRLLHFLSKNL